MSKTIQSPVSKWPGSVVLADPLTYPQSIAYAESVERAKESDNNGLKIRAALLPGIFACVEKWNLQGLEDVTIETFPATPVKSSAQLIFWLSGEINLLFQEGEDVPNA